MFLLTPTPIEVEQRKIAEQEIGNWVKYSVQPINNFRDEKTGLYDVGLQADGLSLGCSIPSYEPWEKLLSERQTKGMPILEGKIKSVRGGHLDLSDCTLSPPTESSK